MAQLNALDFITLLVALAALFTFLNIRYLNLPSTIGLMIISLAVSVAVLMSSFVFEGIQQQAAGILDKYDFSDVLLEVMLSFLLFAGALHVDVKTLREEKWIILTLATVGTLLSTFLIGTAFWYVTGLFGQPLDYILCLLFGAMVSPTDPIAVLSMLKKTNVSKNLEIQIAGESLFNDGVGVVVFLTLCGIAEHAGVIPLGEGMESHGASNLAGIAVLFSQEVFGGIALGAVFGWLGIKLLDAIENQHTELEVLVTLSLVMGGTQLATYMHFSAPLAMVVLGLFLGREGKEDKYQEITGEYVFKFWHLLDEALNAILFILIGLQMMVIDFDATFLLIGLVSIGIVLASRFTAVGLPLAVFRIFKHYPAKTARILTWGGLRGGISVALALSLPLFEGKELLVTTTYCVVVFSILVQGLTIEPIFFRNEGMMGEKEDQPHGEVSTIEAGE